jgi:hypothetical protein
LWGFFSSFVSFLSSLKNDSLIIFIVGISNSVHILLIFNFCFWSFCKYFICFEFHHLIIICHILCFLIWSLFFWFLIFFLIFFCKSLICF